VALGACQVGTRERYAFDTTAGSDAGGAAGGDRETGGSLSQGGAGSPGAPSSAGNGGRDPNGGAAAMPQDPGAEGGSESGDGGSATSDEPGGAAGAMSAPDPGSDPETGGAAAVPACTTEGEIRCRGEAQRDRETCAASVWVPAASCAENEVCNGDSGDCAVLSEFCLGRHAGEQYCDDNTLVTCSADLLSHTESGCFGLCVESGGSAECAAASCGDGIEQPEEACDDGNATNGDGCSKACAHEPVAVFAGGQQSCALTTTGSLRCWGDNASGELGLGDTKARGIEATELGSALKGPDLGVHTVKQVALGQSHSCALLDDDTLRCWGLNESGRLGHGDTVTRGDGAGEMGSALPITQLGGSGRATAVAAGEAHSCALLSGGRVKCWGSNASGQLGLGDTMARGGAAMQMGDQLGSVDLGPSRTAKKIAAGVAHSCAVLDPDTVKCWGKNDRGQLGRGDTDARGDEPDEMSVLTPIDLGPDVVVLDVVAGAVHTCALLRGGQIKCWGGNDLGQLGLGNTEDRGDEPGEMGTALAAVNLGRSAVALTAGFNHTCALLDNQSVKCWGGNGLGQLGQGDTAHRGDAEGELGVQLPSIQLGAGRTVRALSAGWAHACALLDDGSIRCWGHNASGQLGAGNTNSYGNLQGTLGDALPTVKLDF